MADEAGAAVQEENFDLLMDVPLTISVELGSTRMRLQELIDLGKGSIVELDRLAGEPVDVLVNGRPIAIAEIVVSNERYGVRIVAVKSASDRVESLG